MKEETCCFTGHRKIERQELAGLKKMLRWEILRQIADGVRYFGAGGALGFDMLAEETVLELRAVFPSIRLILVLPCRDQTKNWKMADILQYEKIRKRADKVVYVSDRYYPGCMLERDRMLAHSSSRCICYLTRRSGGTFYTVNCCIKAGVSVINLAEREAPAEKSAVFPEIRTG